MFWAIIGIIIFSALPELSVKFFLSDALEFSRNSGVAFGIFANYPEISLILATVVFAMIFYVAISEIFEFRTRIFFAVMCGGAFANLFERVIFGAVYDWLPMRIFGIDFALRFNVADLEIAFGALLAFLMIFLRFLRGEIFMNYRDLGKTGVKVSEIAMGCEGFSEENFAMTKKLFDFAEKHGINYFDLYTSNPQVRAAVGNALKNRREKFVIQSHLCSVWKNGQYERTRDLREVKAGFSEMLKLLQVDYIDVGMIHYCDALSDWREILNNGILDYARELKASGKIKFVGLSSHNPEVALEAVESGAIEVLMFSVNPCYDLQPASEDVEELWNEANYENHLTNMDPEREKLYETCQRLGVGITVMKCFGGGDLLNAELSPAGAALTVNQCISYALSRPGVSCVLAGAHSLEQLQESLAYESASESEKDYALALSSFPKISWKGHCMYCSHCEPCPMKIDIASVTKFLNLAESQKQIPETVREHYKVLEHHAGECVKCGACEKRCPFGVAIRDNMSRAEDIFGF